MSGGGNNATIAMPGPEWTVLLPTSFSDFQLDIVGFLAILGEGSVSANAQVAALSRLFYLPRIIPAPQALLWPSRPVSLPPRPATVTGVYSGNVKDHVHHVANVLLGEDMPTFTVRCVEVKKRTEPQAVTRIDTFFRGQPARAKTHSPATMRPPSVKATATGPLAWVTLLGFSFSVTLFIASLVFGDGMSLIATVLLSILSTVVGVGNKWTLRLPQRAPDKVPPGDVVIRYPNGSYLVVRCDEDVARELYFAPEELEYNIKSAAGYRLISLVGTLLLMLGVIALANARLEMQFAWAGAFIFINVAQWIAAALPQRLHWDLSCYEVKEQGVWTGPQNPNFTEALWRAIMLTKDTRWVRIGKAAPQTEAWDAWLRQAKLQCQHVQKQVKPGDLIDPLYPNRNPVKGEVWEDMEQWKPKEAWNRLNEDILEAEKNDTMYTVRPAQTV